MIRVLICHQSNLVSAALAAVLNQEADLAVEAYSGEVDGLVPRTFRHRPDVLVLDHATGGALSPVGLCEQLIDTMPKLSVLILMDALSCRRFGADLARLAPSVGLVDINTSPADLVRGIRRLTDGQPVLDVHLAMAALKAGQNPLTPRERDVLRLAVHGAPVADIADTLFLSTGTVRNYLSRVTAKTGARTRIEAIRIAEASGWI